VRADALAAGQHAQHLARHVVGRRAAGGVEQQRPLDAFERRLQLARRACHGQGRAEDVGVEAKLLDRADAEAVGGHQPEAAAVARALLRRELGNGRGLADARRADEHFDGREVVVRRRQRRQLVHQGAANELEAGAAAMPRRQRGRDVAGQGAVESGGLQSSGDLVGGAGRISHHALGRGRDRLVPVFRHRRPFGGGRQLDDTGPEPSLHAGRGDHSRRQYERVGPEFLAHGAKGFLDGFPPEPL
jgi:hypothetical protein